MDQVKKQRQEDRQRFQSVVNLATHLSNYVPPDGIFTDAQKQQIAQFTNAVKRSIDSTLGPLLAQRGEIEVFEKESNRVDVNIAMEQKELKHLENLINRTKEDLKKVNEGFRK